MIRYTTGNLLASGAEALVNTVNTMGVSGKGIALMFKDAFPENYKAYRLAAAAGLVEVGKMHVTERHDMLGPRLIVNFPTKQHWRNPSQLEWIEQGLVALREEIARRAIRSIAIPPLGAGNGGLAWSEVKPLIHRALADIDAEVVVFEPTDVHQNVVKRHGVEKLTPARALLTESIRLYEVASLNCSVMEAQKLAWFLSRSAERQELGHPIATDFKPHRYGPYSDSVRHLLDSLDGSYLACDTRLADAKPFDPIRFRDEKRDRVAAYLTTPEAKPFAHLPADVARTIDRFESAGDLELLATLDWLHHRCGVAHETAAMREAIRRWPGPDGAAERKNRLFSDRDLGIALDHLQRVETRLTASPTSQVR